MTQHSYRRRSSFSPEQLLQIPGIRLLLFYILPFLVINGLIFFLVTAKPKYELTVGETHDYQTTDITFSITSHMPLKTVTITMDSQPLDLVKTGNKTYQATISKNGILEIYMENFNGMAIYGYEMIDILDNESPDLTSYQVENGVLTFTVSDSQSGVDFDSIHGTTDSGQTVEPLSVDRSNSTVQFQLGSQGLTVSIKDMSGNEYLPHFSVTEAADTDNDPSTQETEVYLQ